VLSQIPAGGASYTAILCQLPGITREQLDAALLALDRAGKINGTLGRFFLPGAYADIVAELPTEAVVQEALEADEQYCRGCHRLRPGGDFERATPRSGRRGLGGFRWCFSCRLLQDQRAEWRAANALGATDRAS